MLDFSQENDLWQAIQTAETDSQQQQVLEFVRLLLEKVAQNNPNFTTWDKDDLTDVLLEYQGAGQHIAQFLQAALPHLDTDYKNTTFEDELQAIQQQLATLTQSSQKAQKAQKELENQRQQLQKNLQNHAQQDEKLAALRNQVAELQKQLDTLQAEQPDKEQIAQASEQVRQQAVQAIVAAIPQIVDLIKINRDIAQTHFDTNRDITKAIQRELDLVTTKAARHTQRIEQLQDEINQKLQEFDQALQALMATDEQQRQTLRQLREVNTLN